MRLTARRAGSGGSSPDLVEVESQYSEFPSAYTYRISRRIWKHFIEQLSIENMSLRFMTCNCDHFVFKSVHT